MNPALASCSQSDWRQGPQARLFPLLLLLLGFAARPVIAAPGDPDPAFSQDGRVRLGFDGGLDAANAVAVQSDGKFVVAGGGQNGGLRVAEALVVRYNTDGTLDPTFGQGGVAWIYASGDTFVVANAVAIQTDGKIVVGGYTESSNFQQWFVARLNANGTPDPTFNYDGIADLAIANGRIQALLVLGDGRILVAGSFGTPVRHIAVGRLTSTGTRDGTFDVDGVATTPIMDSSIAYSLVVIGTKYLAVGGATQYSPSSSAIALVQFNDTGARDTAFSGDGIQTTFVGSQAQGRAVTLHAGTSTATKIVVAGEANNGTAYKQVVVLRYLTDGSLDTTFDSDGYVLPYLGNIDNGALAVRVANLAGNPSRIYVAGFSQTTVSVASAELVVVKLNLAGVADGTFDGDGIARTNFGPGGAKGNAMFLSGRLTVVGTASGTSAGSDVAIARYVVADGSLDAAFDGDGKRRDDFGHPWSEARDVAIQANGRIVVAGTVRRSSPRSAAVRFLADGTLDPGFAAGGRLEFAIADDESQANAVLLQSNGKIVLGGDAGYPNRHALTRHFADGSVDNSFGSNGVSLDPATATGTYTDLLPQSNGKLIALGLREEGSDLYVCLARYDSTGHLDATFGTAGTGIWYGWSQRYPSTPNPAMAVLPDGRILVTCEYGGDPPEGIALLRFTADGVADASFGVNGHALSDLGADLDTPNAIVVRPDGRIVVAGSRVTSGATKALVVRYRSDGTLDPSFGEDGTVVIDFDGFYRPASAMAVRLQADGRVVVAGFGSPEGHADFGMFRLEPHGALDTSYGVGGMRLLDFSAVSEDQASALALDAAGNAVLAGQSNFNFAVARVLAGNLATGVPDPVPAISRLRVSAPHPNPTPFGAAIELELDMPMRTSATLFDVFGRVVRVLLADRLLDAGRHTLAWDGRIQPDRPAAPGVYFLRVVTPAGDEVRRITVVR